MASLRDRSVAAPTHLISVRVSSRLRPQMHSTREGTRPSRVGGRISGWRYFLWRRRTPNASPAAASINNPPLNPFFSPRRARAQLAEALASPWQVFPEQLPLDEASRVMFALIVSVRAVIHD